MSATTTPIQQGADLVIKAVGENLGDQIKALGPNSTPPVDASDVNKAREALRALSGWQLRNDILVMDQDTKTYSINEAAIDALSEEDAAEGAALYNATVETHLPIIPALYAVGQQGYVAYFSEVHKKVEHLMEPPITVVTEASMDQVAKAALSFVDAVAHDADGLARVGGVTTLDVEALTVALADAGYLVPGENPARDKDRSLSDQGPRGTYEQKTAIYEQASAIATNVGAIGTVQGLDGVAIASTALQASVDAAETETRPVFFTSRAGQAAPGSDLHAEDMKSIMMTMLLAAKVVQNAQLGTDEEMFDPENPLVVISNRFSTVDREGNVTERTDLMAAFKAHLAKDEEDNIPGVLRNDDLYIPDLARNGTETRAVTKLLKGFYSAADALAKYEHDPNAYIEADAGGMSLGGPHASWSGGEKGESEGGDFDHAVEAALESGAPGEFDTEFDLDGDEENEDGSKGGSFASKGAALEVQAEQMARASGIALETPETYVPEAAVEKVARLLDEAVAMGLVDRLGRVSGRDEQHAANDAAIFSGNAVAHFGGYEDVVNAGMEGMSKGGQVYDHDLYSFGMIARMSPEVGERIKRSGAIRIDETAAALVKQDQEKGTTKDEQAQEGEGKARRTKRSVFEKMGHKEGSAATAPKRVARLVEKGLGMDEKGQPNLLFRSTLRKMADRPIVASTLDEAQAWREQAKAFVEREREEHKLRLEAQRDKAGLWTIDLPRDKVERMAVVASAGDKGDDPFHVHIDRKDKVVTLYRDDAPVVKAAIADMPEDVRDPQEPKVKRQINGRELGGMLSPTQIKAALQAADTGETKVRLVMAGETVKGVTSQFNSEQTRAAERAQAPKPKGLEAHLPDVLG